MLFLISYTRFDHKRSDALTLVASMDAHEVDRYPNIKILGRWHDISHAAGTVIVEAPDTKRVAAWVSNWSESTCDVECKPICDDNVAREVMLMKKPTCVVSYDNIGGEPMEGESIFLAYFKLHPEHKMAAYATLANTTEDEAKVDASLCRLLGRYHDLGEGSGVSIFAAKNKKDIDGFAFNWTVVIDGYVVPVFTDKGVKDVIRRKPGFLNKLAALMA